MCVSRIFVSYQNPLFLRWIAVTICRSVCAPLQMDCYLRRIHFWGTYPWAPSRPSAVWCGGVWGGVDSNGWCCTDVCKSILAGEMNCANPNPKPNSQYISWVRKGLGTLSLQSIWEYELMAAIAIRPLTQPLTCEIGYSIFSAMIQLKVASTTWASLPIIPSTERTNGGKCFCCSWKCLLFLSSFIFQPSKKRIHSLFYIGLCVNITKYDVNDGILLDHPYSPD